MLNKATRLLNPNPKKILIKNKQINKKIASLGQTTHDILDSGMPQTDIVLRPG